MSGIWLLISAGITWVQDGWLPVLIIALLCLGGWLARR